MCYGLAPQRIPVDAIPGALLADRAAAAVVAATHSAEESGLRNVSFREGDAAQMKFDRSFDAVVGRYVLLFQSDPAAMVRELARQGRPGGLVMFHEATSPDL